MSDRIPARARILDAASERFYARGVAATGIDVIIADAGVAKMSLYNNFASKADLVSAYLERRHQEFLERHRHRVEALPAGAGPGARALTVFDAYLDGIDDPFRGCGLLNAAGELPTGDPGREAVARHKAEVEDLLRDALGTRRSPSTSPCSSRAPWSAPDWRATRTASAAPVGWRRSCWTRSEPHRYPVESAGRPGSWTSSR